MNTIAQTSNFGLYVTDDNTESFKTWRESMNATSNSNMTIIDEELAKRSETYYCTCSTAAGTSTKVVSSANTNFELKTGAIINIKFANGNTASSVQLNVDGTGAKDARPVVGESTFSDQWKSGQVISFVYDGTYWIYCGGGGGNNSSTYYGECSTAAATQAKTVTITGFPTTLTAGLSIRIKFANAQTYNGAPTLQVNSTGAKTIRRIGGTSAARYEWTTGEVLDLVYDGTYWVLVDGGIASTTYYGVTKLASEISDSTVLAATPALVKTAYDLANGKQGSITANGILKGNGSGTISAAEAGVDYQSPLIAGTDYATPSSIPVAATATPIMDGTAAVGSSTKFAKEDHVHPSDTTKANLNSPAFTGNPTAPTQTTGNNSISVATTAFVQNTVDAKITYGTADLTEGASLLATGVIYLVYE